MTDSTVRYSVCDREDDPFMERCEDGDWVNFADYARLKARVAAADKLAEEMTRLMRRTPFVPAPNGIAVTITVDQIADQKAALAAYQATKGPSE